MKEIKEFKLNETGEKVAVSRYYQKNDKGEIIENWSGLVLRVVNHVCRNESTDFKNKLIDLIGKTEFLPNSPCLVNAGRKTNKAGLMACYVSKAPEDTWNSMCETIKNFGDVARAGGGCGLFLGNIRPEGSQVFGSTHAKACGPIEHMRMISEVMSSITQAGFRGMANLASLNISHPDIINFIKCKQKERGLKTYLREDIFKHYGQIIESIEPQLQIVLDKFLYNFNISVLVSDKFMKAVEKDSDWSLSFDKKVHQTVKAKEIFDLIAENAWKNGDPGFLFEDTINENSPYRFSGQKIETSNPCTIGSTKILIISSKGKILNKRIDKLVGKRTNVWNGQEWSEVEPKITGYNKPVIKITTSENKSLTCTYLHSFVLQDGNRIKAIDLKIGDILVDTKGPEYLPLKGGRITKIEDMGIAKVVYCFNEPLKHQGVFNGILTGQCGEQVLPSSNSNCNLGSIDVSKFYDEKEGCVDWDRLKDAIDLAFQFLDDVIDVHDFPSETFKEWGMNNRPVGLGIMGFADLLIKLKLKYGSKESIKFGEKLMKFFADTSHNKSIELAKERGAPKCCKYKELEFRRNITTTSIAPTGTISILAGCSSSIEPIFSPVIFRHDNTGSYEMKHPDSENEWFACALDGDGGPREVKYQEHVLMQAAFQKYCDSGISKTINLPSSATIDDVKKAYFMAWENKCKGITVYRNNSKTTQVLNLTNKIHSKNTDKKIERPSELNCDIFKVKADGIEWHIIVGLKDKNPYELFAVNGGKVLPEKGVIVKIKKRHYSLLDENKNILLENIIESENKIDPRIGLETRRFSLELRHGIPPKYIVEQIDKSNDVITSFSKATARIFKKHYLEENVVSGVVCPECLKNGKESKMRYTSGCSSCEVCNFSRCG